MSTSYLDLDGFRSHTILPDEDVNEVELRYPGWIATQLAAASQKIDARLRKRYAVPFAEPYPLTVQSWLARIVSLKVLHKRGVDSNDQQYAEIRDDANTVFDELREAADSTDGLYELPTNADTSSSGVVRGGPYFYSESSPYVWTDTQASVGRVEDARRRGSHG